MKIDDKCLNPKKSNIKFGLYFHSFFIIKI